MRAKQLELYTMFRDRGLLDRPNDSIEDINRAAVDAADVAINDLGIHADLEELYDHGIGRFHAKLDGEFE